MKFLREFKKWFQPDSKVDSIPSYFLQHWKDGTFESDGPSLDEVFRDIERSRQPSFIEDERELSGKSPSEDLN